jgi:hypothetical protein
MLSYSKLDDADAGEREAVTAAKQMVELSLWNHPHKKVHM